MTAFADAADVPPGLMQFILQGGAFALLSIVILFGVPWIVRQWKEMTTDMTKAMKAISDAMQELSLSTSRRLDRIEDHLDIGERER